MGRLNSTGSSSALKQILFPAGFAGEVMALILDEWRHFSRRREVRLETRITAVFREALVRAYVAADKNWFITPEEPITDPDYGTELGRNDIRVYPPKHQGQTVFFVVECKRLRVTTDSGFKHYAIEYVEDGMQRFVNGLYASKLPSGGMLGYVMDNRLDDAFQRIQGEIETRRTKLKMKAPLQASSSKLSHYRWSADTFHERSDGTLCIHHLLVAASVDQTE
ncbi:MAG: hypothetical protein K8R46_10580 [Pirellulales bacterium]|nr:hypothetical protein [Pirellulales bacterium]